MFGAIACGAGVVGEVVMFGVVVVIFGVVGVFAVMFGDIACGAGVTDGVVGGGNVIVHKNAAGVCPSFPTLSRALTSRL